MCLNDTVCDFFPLPFSCQWTEKPQIVNVLFPLGVTVLTFQTLLLLKVVRLWTAEGWHSGSAHCFLIKHSYRVVGLHDVNTQVLTSHTLVVMCFSTSCLPRKKYLTSEFRFLTVAPLDVSNVDIVLVDFQQLLMEKEKDDIAVCLVCTWGVGCVGHLSQDLFWQEIRLFWSFGQIWTLVETDKDWASHT